MEGNKVSPLIQGGLRGVKGLPDTTVKQCDIVELFTEKESSLASQVGGERGPKSFLRLTIMKHFTVNLVYNTEVLRDI